MVTTARTVATLARVVRHPIAMQIGAVGVEPGLGARDVRADALDHAPEPARVVHFDKMRDLVRREIVEHEPQRLDGSRIDTRLIATPSASAARRLAASRSLLTSRLRKSDTRRAICGSSPATQSR